MSNWTEDVVFEACRACAEDYKVVKDLENLGISVEYMGEPLTNYLKDESTKVVKF